MAIYDEGSYKVNNASAQATKDYNMIVQFLRKDSGSSSPTGDVYVTEITDIINGNGDVFDVIPVNCGLTPEPGVYFNVRRYGDRYFFDLSNNSGADYSSGETFAVMVLTED